MLYVQTEKKWHEVRVAGFCKGKLTKEGYMYMLVCITCLYMILYIRTIFIFCTCDKNVTNVNGT